MSEPWRALRDVEVDAGLRGRLLDGIERRRARRRRAVAAGAFAVAAAGAIALWATSRREAHSESEAVVATAPAPSVQPTAHPERSPGVARAKSKEPAPAVADLPPTAHPERSPGAARAESKEPKRKRRPARIREDDQQFAGSGHRDSADIESSDLDLPASSLRDQVRALRAARALSGAAALAALREHRARWPDSPMRREVDLAIIDRLRDLGRTGDARAEAARFASAHPNDARAPAMRALAEGVR